MLTGLKNRYRVLGTLVLDTALHIGGGRQDLPLTDSPILRNANEKPIIPGSSLKGALRATVERLAGNFPSLRSCMLCAAGSSCLTVDTTLQNQYKSLKRTRDEADLLDFLGRNLCDTCKLFGSPFSASKLTTFDSSVLEPWAGITEIRDGVGLDRDTDRAVDRIKYDFEAVPSGSRFRFEMVIENAQDSDLALMALGVSELMSGMVPLGGIRSRGLGRCHLELERIEMVDFTSGDSVARYLGHREMDSVGDPNEFLQICLSPLWERRTG